jgi:hypothetical protein
LLRNFPPLLRVRLSLSDQRKRHRNDFSHIRKDCAR